MVVAAQKLHKQCLSLRSHCLELRFLLWGDGDRENIVAQRKLPSVKKNSRQWRNSNNLCHTGQILVSASIGKVKWPYPQLVPLQPGGGHPSKNGQLDTSSQEAKSQVLEARSESSLRDSMVEGCWGAHLLQKRLLCSLLHSGNYELLQSPTLTQTLLLSVLQPLCLTTPFWMSSWYISSCCSWLHSMLHQGTQTQLQSEEIKSDSKSRGWQTLALNLMCSGIGIMPSYCPTFKDMGLTSEFITAS